MHEVSVWQSLYWVRYYTEAINKESKRILQLENGSGGSAGGYCRPCFWRRRSRRWALLHFQDWLLTHPSCSVSSFLWSWWNPWSNLALHPVGPNPQTGALIAMVWCSSANYTHERRRNKNFSAMKDHLCTNASKGCIHHCFQQPFFRRRN